MYKHHYYLVPPQAKPFKKQTKNKLMLCKPLFIVHARVKCLLKVIPEYKEETSQLEKWAWHMNNEIA